MGAFFCLKNYRSEKKALYYNHAVNDCTNMNMNKVRNQMTRPMNVNSFIAAQRQGQFKDLNDQNVVETLWEKAPPAGQLQQRTENMMMRLMSFLNVQNMVDPSKATVQFFYSGVACYFVISEGFKSVFVSDRPDPRETNKGVMVALNFTNPRQMSVEGPWYEILEAARNFKK